MIFPPAVETELDRKAAAFRCGGRPGGSGCGSPDFVVEAEWTEPGGRHGVKSFALAMRKYRCQSCGTALLTCYPFDPPVGFDMRESVRVR